MPLRGCHPIPLTYIGNIINLDDIEKSGDIKLLTSYEHSYEQSSKWLVMNALEEGGHPIITKEREITETPR